MHIYTKLNYDQKSPNKINQNIKLKINNHQSRTDHEQNKIENPKRNLLSFNYFWGLTKSESQVLINEKNVIRGN